MLHYLGPQVDRQVAQMIVFSGANFSGAGWTTGRAIKLLYELTGVAMVTGKLLDNLNSWLFAIYFYWSLDIQTADLGDRVAEAAFGLVGFMQESGVEEDMPEEESGSESDAVVFPWDQPANHPPKDLKEL